MKLIQINEYNKVPSRSVLSPSATCTSLAFASKEVSGLLPCDACWQWLGFFLQKIRVWVLVGLNFQGFAFNFLVKCALVVGQVPVDPGLGNLAVEGRAL